MKIILFGVRGSGKDTIGDYLSQRYRFQKHSFAGPLKQMIKIAFPDFKDEDLHGPSKNRENQYEQYPMGDTCLKCDSPLFENAGARHGEEQVCGVCGMTYPRHLDPRTALKTLGTEWGRRLYKSVWIDLAFSRMRQESSHTHFVVTDGRFLNEQERSTALGGITVLLLRRLDESEKATHESERELSLIPRARFHYVLDNRCPLEDMPTRVDAMMATISEKAR